MSRSGLPSRGALPTPLLAAALPRFSLPLDHSVSSPVPFLAHILNRASFHACLLTILCSDLRTHPHCVATVV